MNQRSESADEESNGILSRENQKKTVQLLAGMLSEPLENLVKDAVQELEAEQDEAGETSASQFFLLALLGVVAAMYLSNKRRQESQSGSTDGGDRRGTNGDGESRHEDREELAAGVDSGRSSSSAALSEESGDERDGEDSDGEN